MNTNGKVGERGPRKRLTRDQSKRLKAMAREVKRDPGSYPLLQKVLDRALSPLHMTDYQERYALEDRQVHG